MQYYTSGGKSWLGMKSLSAGGVIEPVAGPLADSTRGQRGMTLEYLDRNDAATATLAAVRAIRLSLRGVTDEKTYRSGGQSGAVDTLSMTARVALEERAPAVTPARVGNERGMALAVPSSRSSSSRRSWPAPSSPATSSSAPAAIRSTPRRPPTRPNRACRASSPTGIRR